MSIPTNSLTVAARTTADAPKVTTDTGRSGVTVDWQPIAHDGLHISPSQQSPFADESIRHGRAKAEPHAANRIGSTSAKTR